MDATQRARFIRQRAVAKASLTRRQSSIDTGESKLNDIKVRFEELPNIYNKFETAQCVLQLLDYTDYSLDRQQFKD